MHVEGLVVDGDGQPQVGLRVAALAAGQLVASAVTTSDPDGRFTLTLAPGHYGLAATSPTLTAGYLDDVVVQPLQPVTGLELTVGGPGHLLSGVVRDEAGQPVPGVLAGAARIGPHIGDLFLVETGADGAYQLRLPPGEYTVRSEAPAHRQFVFTDPLALDADRVVDIELVSRAWLEQPPPDAVIAWMKSAAVALATVEPGHGFADLKPLAALVSKPRIVALGEATHGTREFFQLKHRLLEYLVAEHGFTVFALEASWPESIAVNDYVQGGAGDARAALAGMRFWIWDTEEMLALIEWMRAWNADPAHTRKLQFYGFDMQASPAAVALLVEYLARVDPEQAELAAGLFLPLAGEDEQQAILLLDGTTRAGLRKYVKELLARFDRRQKAWSKQTSAREWRQARQHAVMLDQAIGFDAAATATAIDNARDRAMADNVIWIAEKAEPGAKVVVWGHNGHISRAGYRDFASMGQHLAARYRRKYVAIGLAFGEGAFQAIGADGLGEQTVGAPAPGSVEAALASLGLPLLLLDLRKPPRGEVAAWLRAPHLVRQAGALFTGALDMEMLESLADGYDALMFVARTTRARPIRPGPAAR